MQEQQDQQALTQPQGSERYRPPKREKPARAQATRNLYEPYVTPAWFWVSLRSVARFIFFLFLDVRLKGRQNVPKQGPYIIASNHINWTDIPLVPCYLKSQVVYIAKEELFEGKLGWLVRFLGAIPVRRGEADRQLLRAADDLLKRGRIITIFPEGHRSETRQMIPANAGVGMIALRAGVPVIPVAISGSEFALKKFRPRITITYGEPLILQPKGAKIVKDDITESADHIMRSIAAMLPPAYRGVYGDQTEQE